MEDIINMLLDVVRAQHSATEGTDEAPFNMDDIVDMAMNLVGRPDEPEGEAAMVTSIQNMVQELAPDIFPPKTFEQQSDEERAASVTNMIQQSMMNSSRAEQPAEAASYLSAYEPEEEDDEPAQDPASLNDMIYRNLMDMMGLQNPQVEYPFDRSQVVYGKEQSFTEQMEDAQREEAQARKLSAWELAQNIIDADEEAHQKETYIPQFEEPTTKSASQLANEAIKQSEERNRMQLEIEKRAEAMMEEARKRGQDPMQFALHQQEILQYMEKNSDELVSFEDYEDLSPEEKMEIERQILIEKGMDPNQATRSAQQAVTGELSEDSDEGQTQGAKENGEKITEMQSETASGSPIPEGFSEEMLRQLSQEVLRENSEMILAEDANEDMEDLNRQLMENIMKMMSGSGVPVAQDNVDDLLEEVIEQTEGKQTADESADTATQAQMEKPEETSGEPAERRIPQGISAVELAMAAQKAMNTGKTERAEETQAHEEPVIGKTPDEDPFADMDDIDDIDDIDEKDDKIDIADMDDIEDIDDVDEIKTEKETSKETAGAGEVTQEEPEEYEYVDPDELVLGEHTQAEVDEALENLNSLGLEGDVYERAKRMLLLELASSEAELDAWLKDQEEGKKKKAAATGISDDLSDIDDDDLDFDLDDSDDEEEPELDEVLAESEAEASEKPAVDAAAEDESGEKDPEEGGSLEEQEEPEDEIETIVIDLTPPQEAVKEESQPEPAVTTRAKKTVFKKKERQPAPESRIRPEDDSREAEAKGYQVSVRSPFVLKNSASYMDKFEEYILDNQENRKLTTGFKKLDTMLRYGLHKGSYFIDSYPQYLKNAFMQQMADRAAESGVDVLFISTELSRYELMTDTISRLSYEMNGKNSEKAVSVMSIMTGEDGAGLESLKDELNWYRGRISEHLFILDQEAVDEVIDSMEEASTGDILAEIIRSIVREGAHKPVVFIDNLENIASAEDSVDMEPLMQGIKALAKELSIPIVTAYGYTQRENEEDISFADREFNRSLGNMCDVYLELQYAPMITEDGIDLTPEDIHEMMEDGETLLADIQIHRNRRAMKASCQIMATPKYNFFEE